MIANSYYKKQILEGPNKNDPLFLKTIELEKEMAKTLKKIGFKENNYKLYISPAIDPHNKIFNAIFGLEITMGVNFGYDENHKENIISLPNEKVIEIIIDELINTTRKNLTYCQNKIKIIDKYSEMNHYKNLEAAMIKTLHNLEKFKK